MQKLEWKGPPREGKVECNEVLILGDSMLRNINVDHFARTVHLFSYPGITTGQLIVQIKNDIMPPPSKIGYIVVHCGTNNASTQKHNMSITQSAKEMEHCIETLSKFYTHAKIVVSAILPRNDEQNLRAMDINNLVESFCVPLKQVIFADFCTQFDAKFHPEKFSDLFRYERTKTHPDPLMVDTVHLSEKGIEKFQNCIKQQLDQVTKTKYVNTEKAIQLMTVEEWNKYRNLHREFKFKARFKITNYAPAMDDRSQTALNNETFAQYKERFAQFGNKTNNNSDQKPLPDIIPKKSDPKNRSDSESPIPTRKKSTDDPRKKTESLSKSAIRNQMNLNKVKKSKRERSSRRVERDGDRESSSSPERSVKSDKSSKRRRKSATDQERSPNYRSSRKSPSRKRSELKELPKSSKDKPVSPSRKISLHVAHRKKQENLSADRSGERRGKKRSIEKSKERSREREKKHKKRSKEKIRKRSKDSSRARSKDHMRVKKSRSKERKKNKESSRSQSNADESKLKKNNGSKKSDSESEADSEKVYGIELKRRASHYSENSDKVAEGLSEFLGKDKTREKDVQTDKHKRSESDLKKRLLEKQKAKKKPSKEASKVNPDFFNILFRAAGIPKESCAQLGKSFYNNGFEPTEKNFKSISMFDFGTKYGVPLAQRNKIKSITDKQVKKVSSGSYDLRDLMMDDLIDSDLSDSQF